MYSTMVSVIISNLGGFLKWKISFLFSMYRNLFYFFRTNLMPVFTEILVQILLIRPNLVSSGFLLYFASVPLPCPNSS